MMDRHLYQLFSHQQKCLLQVFQHYVPSAAHFSCLVYNAAFRGIELVGTDVELPPGYQGDYTAKWLLLSVHLGYVLEGNEAGSPAQSTWNATSDFSSVRYWTREVPVDSSDPMRRWISWMHISQAVCLSTFSPCLLS